MLGITGSTSSSLVPPPLWPLPEAVCRECWLLMTHRLCRGMSTMSDHKPSTASSEPSSTCTLGEEFSLHRAHSQLTSFLNKVNGASGCVRRRWAWCKHAQDSECYGHRSPWEINAVRVIHCAYAGAVDRTGDQSRARQF